MKNYYYFDLKHDNESIKYHDSLSKSDLIERLNDEMENIDYYLNYYAKFLRKYFQGSDYDEHYYLMKSLSEGLNNIKIILNILKGKK